MATIVPEADDSPAQAQERLREILAGLGLQHRARSLHLDVGEGLLRLRPTQHQRGPVQQRLHGVGQFAVLLLLDLLAFGALLRFLFASLPVEFFALNSQAFRLFSQSLLLGFALLPQALLFGPTLGLFGFPADALLLIVDGRRGLREVWPVALVTGLGFALAQFVTSNYISVELTDIVASLAGLAWLGKSTMALVPGFGPWVMLGVVVSRWRDGWAGAPR